MAGRTLLIRAVLAALSAVIVPASSDAQANAQPGPVRPSAERAVTAGYEVRRDRFRYTFENPSTITTTFLVPHQFTQAYVADNQWLVFSVRFPLADNPLEVEAAFTPEKAASGEDFDTFFNPDGDVIVYGYRTSVNIRSSRVGIWSQGTLGNLPVRLGYVYRRDHSRFDPATERVVTHTSPPSESRTPIDLRETTISEMHEFPIGAVKQFGLNRAWTLVARAETSPFTIARLTTILPLKYPGQSILFQAYVGAVSARLEVGCKLGRWPLTIAVEEARTWSYRSAARLTRDTRQLAITLTRGL